MPEKYFTTGEFAKICNIEKHVLFHYDSIGLFCPSIVKENGYRYYSYHQYDTFAVIRTLKKLGMSLKDIKLYLEARTPSVFLTLLDKKKVEVQDVIQELQDIKDMIEGFQSLTKQALDSTEGFSLVTLPPEHILCSHDMENTNNNDFFLYMKEYIHFSVEHHVRTQESVGNIVTIKNIRKGDYWNFSNLYTATRNSIDGQTKIRREGTYLCGCHYGRYENMEQTYRKMLRYADEQKIPLGIYSYEEYLIADIAQKDESGYVTRLLMETEL